MVPGVLDVQVQWVGLHEGAGEIEHVGTVEGETARVLEHLAGLQLIQVAAVLWLAGRVQVDGDIRGRSLAGRSAAG